MIHCDHCEQEIVNQGQVLFHEDGSLAHLHRECVEPFGARQGSLESWYYEEIPAFLAHLWVGYYPEKSWDDLWSTFRARVLHHKTRYTQK